MKLTKEDASSKSQRPTGTETGKDILDAELYQANHNLKRQTTTAAIIDCDARQMAEEISLGRMIIA